VVRLLAIWCLLLAWGASAQELELPLDPGGQKRGGADEDLTGTPDEVFAELGQLAQGGKPMADLQVGARATAADVR